MFKGNNSYFLDVYNISNEEMTHIIQEQNLCYIVLLFIFN